MGEGSGIGYCGKGEEEKGTKMSWGTELWVRNVYHVNCFIKHHMMIFEKKGFSASEHSDMHCMLVA